MLCNLNVYNKSNVRGSGHIGRSDLGTTLTSIGSGFNPPFCQNVSIKADMEQNNTIKLNI